MDLRYKILTLSSFVLFSFYYVYDFPAALNKNLRTDSNEFQTQHVSLLYSVYAFPNMIIPLFFGYTIKKRLQDAMIVLCFLVFVGHSLYSGGVIASDFKFMLIGRFVYGIGGESFSVIQNNLVTGHFEGKELAFSMAVTSSIARCGTIANFLITPYLSQHFGKFYSCFIGCLLTGIAVSLCFSIKRLNPQYINNQKDVVQYNTSSHKNSNCPDIDSTTDTINTIQSKIETENLDASKIRYDHIRESNLDLITDLENKKTPNIKNDDKIFLIDNSLKKEELIFNENKKHKNRFNIKTDAQKTAEDSEGRDNNHILNKEQDVIHHDIKQMCDEKKFQEIALNEKGFYEKSQEKEKMQNILKNSESDEDSKDFSILFKDTTNEEDDDLCLYDIRLESHCNEIGIIDSTYKQEFDENYTINFSELDIVTSETPEADLWAEEIKKKGPLFDKKPFIYKNEAHKSIEQKFIEPGFHKLNEKIEISNNLSTKKEKPKNVGFTVLVCISFMFAVAWAPYSNIATILLQQRYGLSTIDSGRYLAAQEGISLVITLILGFFTDIFGLKLYFIGFGGILMIIGHFLLFSATGSAAKPIIILSISGPLISCYWPCITYLVSAENIGSGFAIFTCILNIAYTISPLIVSTLALHDRSLDTVEIFIVLTACLAFILIGILAIFDRLHNLRLNRKSFKSKLKK